jgi:hypothetical protein
LQEEKASKVMYGKDAFVIMGTENVTSITSVRLSANVFGRKRNRQNPESFAMNNYQIFYANVKRGLVHRLSRWGYKYCVWNDRLVQRFIYI